MPTTEINAHLKYRNSSGDTTVIYPITKADNIDGILPITSGGTGASDIATARANLGAAPAFTYGTDDILPGSTSEKPDGAMHFVYTTQDGIWDHVKCIFISIDGVWRLVRDMSTFYSITTSLANVTSASSNPATISEGGTVSLTFTANSGYILPDSITVTGATHSWNKSTGKLTLSNPTGDVAISIRAERITYSITTSLTNVAGASSNSVTIYYGGTASLTFTANSGYTLPDSVTVAGATYTWNKSSGRLTLSNPTGNVTVIIEGKVASIYTITTSLTNVTGASSNPTTIVEDSSVSLTFTANSGYTLPDSVTVAGATYTWNKSSGRLTLSNPTGNVTVIIEGKVASIYTITTSLMDVTGASSNPTTIVEDSSVSLTFTANSGYTLPDSVTVTGATYYWNKSTGKLTLSNPTENVTVVIEGVAEVEPTPTPTEYTITTNLTGVTGASSNPTTISEGDTVSLTFTANTDYELPESIKVTGATHKWDINTGELTLSNPSGNVTVVIAGIDIKEYITTININDETVFTKTAIGTSPDVKIRIVSDTTMSDQAQYVYVNDGFEYSEDTGTYVPIYITIFTYNSETKNLVGLSETSGATVATYGVGSHTLSGTAGADTVINLYPVEEDATMYSTIVSINSETVKSFSHKNFSPDIDFVVVDDGIEFTCEATGEEYKATYDGDNVFSGVVIEEADYAIGTGDTLIGYDESDAEYDFTWSEFVVSGDVQPLKFYTLDGSDFTVSTNYGVINNVEYSYDNASWETLSDGLTQRSNLSSSNGVVYLRGTNSTFGVGGINSRGIGLRFSEPVMCTGDLASMLTYEGLVDELDDRIFFGFFIDSTNLLCPPMLPSKTLYPGCYQGLFYNCSSMKVYTSPVDGYSREWRVPTSEIAVVEDGLSPLHNAFVGIATDSTAPVTPEVNTTYYIKDL